MMCKYHPSNGAYLYKNVTVPAMIPPIPPLPRRQIEMNPVESLGLIRPRPKCLYDFLDTSTSNVCKVSKTRPDGDFSVTPASFCTPGASPIISCIDIHNDNDSVVRA